MSLKIRCPHCRKVLVAEDDVAGQRKACPACGRHFTIPERLPDAPSPQVVMPRCPQCRAELGPTATFCHACHTDLKTGKRLPLGRRLRLLSWKTWAVAAFSGAVLVIVVIVGVQLYRIRQQSPPATTTAPVVTASAYEELAADLLRADDDESLTAALRALRTVETRAAPAVAHALDDVAKTPPEDRALSAARRAAIELLVRNRVGHEDLWPAWRVLLAGVAGDEDVGRTALYARAALEDVEVVPAMCDRWLSLLRDRLFLERLADLTETDGPAPLGQQLAMAGRAFEACDEALRVLAAAHETAVYETLLAQYWTSWRWLGQDLGSGLNAAIFALAKPDEDSLEFDPASVRQPRDVMRRISAQSEPLVRAAAGMVIKEQAGMYSRLRARISRTLASLLPDCEPSTQQRLTWTVSQVGGLMFGNAIPQHPLDVTVAEIVAAQEWGAPDAEPVAHVAYPQPPDLVYRVTTAERRLEAELLQLMPSDWISAERALERWLAADLGYTARLDAFLSPGQRRPDYPALAVALVIAAVENEQHLAPQLELWAEAHDQPAWVSALAYTALGSFDARSGSGRHGWPAGLDLGDLRALDNGRPSWSLFGRVLMAGGPRMIAQLKSANPPPMPHGARDRLLSSTEALREAPQP